MWMGIVCAVITTATYFLVPNKYISFGAVHCVLAVSIAMLPFLLIPRIAALVAVVIQILWFTGTWNPKPGMDIHSKILLSSSGEFNFKGLEAKF